MKRAGHFAVAAATAALIAAAAADLAAGNWPQWRGPAGQGISDDQSLPVSWSPGDAVAWKTALPGTGHSSPIVWGSRVFLTVEMEGALLPTPPPPRRPQQDPQSVGADRSQTLQLLALDAASGAILWTRTAFEGAVHDARFKRASFAAPTPVTDGTLVYAYFGPEGLYAYDFSGTLKWKAAETFRTKGVGAGTSPVLFDNLVIVQRDEEDGEDSVILAYDKRTGREAWRTRRPTQMSWATPVLVAAEGRTELIANGQEFVIAYDPASGRELWRTKGLDSGAIQSPLVSDGLVIFTAGCGPKKVVALRPGANVPAAERVAWEYAKGTGCPLSNIAYGGTVYLFTETGIVTTLDAKTGRVTSQGVRPPVPATFMSSPVAFGGFIAITSEEGETFMLEADGTPAFARTNSIGEPVVASAALANGRIFIRGQKHLVAIGR